LTDRLTTPVPRCRGNPPRGDRSSARQHAQRPSSRCRTHRHGCTPPERREELAPARARPGPLPTGGRNAAFDRSARRPSKVVRSSLGSPHDMIRRAPGPRGHVFRSSRAVAPCLATPMTSARAAHATPLRVSRETASWHGEGHGRSRCPATIGLPVARRAPDSHVLLPAVAVAGGRRNLTAKARTASPDHVGRSFASSFPFPWSSAGRFPWSSAGRTGLNRRGLLGRTHQRWCTIPPHRGRLPAHGLA
jgi:hypothetical protein